MPFQPGDRVGAYEILSTLGAGGMGVVYRARDGKLGREVAIKTLPDDVAADGDRLARFEREARALAALSHPNIASIFGFELAGAAHLLVMELVEGETLADLIARGPIAVERALPLFLQIAAGLEAAHAKGIIHRDLKPANIKIAQSASTSSREIKPGAVKILDFGLAKALAPEARAQVMGASHSPTLTLQATMRGELLGTAAYMSPEQVEGEPADARADVWAFAVCLLEALTGQRVFRGGSASQVLASVLKDEPNLAALPAATPPLVRRLLRRCLEKDRERRLHDIADARLEIEEAISAPTVEPALVVAPPARTVSRLQLGVGAIACIALGVAGSLGVAAWRRQALPLEMPTRFVLTAPPNEPVGMIQGSDLAISGDGRSVFYLAGSGISPTLRVRRLDQLEGVPVEGAEPGAYSPFLSPDEQWVGYSAQNVAAGRGRAEGALVVVPVRGGATRTVCTPCTTTGASWGDDDTIVFGSREGPLRVVAAAGGKPRDLTALADGETAHWRPEFLPGGRAVLFAAVTGNVATFNDPAQMAVHALLLSSGERKLLIAGATQPRYAASGHLLYAVGSTLWAVAFDPDRLEVLGDPAPVLEGVALSVFGAAKYAVSPAGALAYVTSGSRVTTSLVWLDRAGREEPVTAPPREYVYPRLSPDGTRVALGVRFEGVWITDLERAVATRLTSSARLEWSPLWSPDGRTIFYGAVQEGAGADVFRVRADGAGEAVRLTEQSSYLMPAAITPDGSRLLAASGASTAGPWQIVELDATAKGEPRTVLPAGFSANNPELSPDGRWLAYTAEESSRNEVFVRPYPAVDSGRQQVSTGGGSRPAWSRDGAELFYLDLDGRLTVASVQTRGDALILGQPQKVSEAVYPASVPARTYDVSADARRFLMVKDNQGGSLPAADASGRIVMVQGWFDELRRLAPPRSR